MSQVCYSHFHLNHYIDQEVYVLHGKIDEDYFYHSDLVGFIVAHIHTLHIINLLLIGLLIKINCIIYCYKSKQISI